MKYMTMIYRFSNFTAKGMCTLNFYSRFGFGGVKHKQTHDIDELPLDLVQMI